MSAAQVLIWKYGVRVDEEQGQYILTTPYAHAAVALDFGEALRELNLELPVVYFQER